MQRRGCMRNHGTFEALPKYGTGPRWGYWEVLPTFVVGIYVI